MTILSVRSREGTLGNTIELTVDPIRTNTTTTELAPPPDPSTASPPEAASSHTAKLPWWWLLVAAGVGFGLAWLVLSDDDEGDDPPLG